MRARANPLTAKAGRLLPAFALLLLAATAPAQDGREAAPLLEAPRVPAQAIREPSPPAADKATDRIVREVERRHKARVVKAEESTVDGRKVLVLRLLDEKSGKVRHVRVDVETGKEL